MSTKVHIHVNKKTLKKFQFMTRQSSLKNIFSTVTFFFWSSTNFLSTIKPEPLFRILLTELPGSISKQRTSLKLISLRINMFAYGPSEILGELLSLKKKKKFFKGQYFLYQNWQYEIAIQNKMLKYSQKSFSNYLKI